MMRTFPPFCAAMGSIWMLTSRNMGGMTKKDIFATAGSIIELLHKVTSIYSKILAKTTIFVDR